MTPKLDELSQLLRLRRLRVEAARLAREEKRRALDEAIAAVRAREAEIERLRGERGDLRERIVADIAPTLPRFMHYVGARVEMLDDLLERAEYGLIDDEEDLEAAQEAFDDATAAWQQAMARCDAVQRLRDTTARRLRRAAEEKTERELDAPSRPLLAPNTP